MSARRATPPAATGRRLKSPLAVHSDQQAITDFDVHDRRGIATVSDRATVVDEFDEYLRTTTNREGRPYEEATISAYLCPAKHLDRWMGDQGIEGDFAVVDTRMLNRYFRKYYNEHGQGGTHTLQRNLLQLFNFLERSTAIPACTTTG